MDFTLTSEQRMLRDLARDFAHREIAPLAAAYDQSAEFPHPIVRQAREIGLINLSIPAAYGGPGLSVLDICLVVEELSWACTGITSALSINSLAADPIVIAGDETQKRRYLGLLVDGGFGSYCVTEPNTGSDVASIETRARQVGDTYVLNGTKIWISNAWEANFYVVFARTDPTAGHNGLSAFIVDRDLPGVSVSRKLRKMGQRAADACEVVFQDVELGRAQLLGKEGDGFRIAMKVFDGSRPMVAATAVGLCQRALDESRVYARTRRAFGRPIAEFQGVSFKIAEMGMRTQASRLLTYQAAWKADQGERNTLEAAYAKALAADTAMWAATEAVQIHGGYGYSEEFPVEKLMRDAKVLQIYEGTSEIQRTIMVRELTRQA
jgi:acyl-CoA dehydrogenase